jgi:hypothetical protein
MYEFSTERFDRMVNTPASYSGGPQIQNEQSLIYKAKSCSTICHEGAWEERKYSSYLFSISALGGVSGQRHASAGTLCTGGWVGPRAGLDTEATGKILYLCRGSNLDRPVVQPVARHCTD